MDKFIVKKYESRFLPDMARLFYDTVHTVNRADYTRRQPDGLTLNGGINLSAGITACWFLTVKSWWGSVIWTTPDTWTGCMCTDAISAAV